MKTREKVMVAVLGSVVGLYAYDAMFLTPWLARLDAAEQQAAEAQLELETSDLVFERRRRVSNTWREGARDSVPGSRMAAEGDLYNLVPQWVDEAGLNLNNIRPQRETTQHQFGQINIEVRATGDLSAVGRFLYAIDHADVPVRVSDFSLSSQAEGEGNLVAQFTLSTIYDLPREAT